MNLALHHAGRVTDWELRQLERDGVSLWTPAPFDAVRCYQAFGGSRSESRTTAQDLRTAASEGSVAIGAEGRLVEGLDVSGPGAKVGSTEISGGGDVTVTTADPELLIKALEAYRDISLGTTSQFSTFAEQTHKQQAQDLATLLGALGQLETQTDEKTQEKRTIIYVVFGLLALLGVIFWPFFRKSR